MNNYTIVDRPHFDPRDVKFGGYFCPHFDQNTIYQRINPTKLCIKSGNKQLCINIKTGKVKRLSDFEKVYKMEILDEPRFRKS